MRVRASVAAAIAAATLASAQAPPGEIAFVVDTDSPVASRSEVRHMTGLALQEIAAQRTAIILELTAEAARRLPAPEEAPLRFVFRPRTYSGVTLEFREATEILRKNEAVRDEVIRRVCGDARLRDCPGAVHAAAVALVRDTAADSAAKLERFVAFAQAAPARTIVLVTAGWPYRDERALPLSKAIQRLKGARATLTVWKLPSAVPVAGLVRDAVDTMTERLGARVIPLVSDADMQVARAAIGEPHARATGDVRATPASASEAPRVQENAVGDATSSPDAVLSRAAAYIERFERTFSSIIWRERYVQEQRVTRRFGSSGGRFSSLAARRIVDSEMLLLWLPEDASWIAIRDVLEVDGRARPSRERRLQPALTAGQLSIRHLRQLAQENGSINIGSIVRTFNEPTLALLFLDAQYRGRFAFTRRGRDAVQGQPAVTFGFVERTRPTVIQEGNRDVIARGVLWINGSSGEILQTRLEIANDAEHLGGEMTVTYGAHPRFDVRVPIEMRERYTSGTGEEVTCVATYSDFRRFETSGRIIPN